MAETLEDDSSALREEDVVHDTLDFLFHDHLNHPFLLDPQFPRFPSRQAALQLFKEYADKGLSIGMFDAWAILDERMESKEVVESSVCGESVIEEGSLDGGGLEERVRWMSPVIAEGCEPHNSFIPLDPRLPSHSDAPHSAHEELRQRTARRRAIKLEGRMRGLTREYFNLIRRKLVPSRLDAYDMVQLHVSMDALARIRRRLAKKRHRLLKIAGVQA